MRINNTSQDAIILENEVIEDVNSFTYLGSVMATDGGTEQDVNVKIGKAGTAFSGSDLSGYQRR